MSEKKEIGMFPSEFASVEEKSKHKWLLQYAQAIDYYSGWWGGRNMGLLRQNIVRNRKYVAGTQSPNIYRDKIYGSKNFAQLNLFINTSSPLGTIVNNVVGQLRNQGYRPKVKSISPESQTRYDRKLAEAKADNAIMKSADELRQLGIQPEKLVKNMEVFEYGDELEMHFEMNFKDNAALALNIALEYVFSVNSFELIENKVLRDLVIAGRAGIAVDSFKNGNLVVRLVDIANFGSSAVIKEDYGDAVYAFEYRMVSINDLAKMANGELSEEDLFEAAQIASSRFNAGVWSWGREYYPSLIDNGRPWGNFSIGILDFKLLSTNNIVVKDVGNKRAGGPKIKEANEDYRPKKDEEVLKVPVERRYKAKYIVGTQKLFDYGLDECTYDTTDYGGISTASDLGYYIFAPNIYEMQNSSIVDNLIGLVDEWIFLKLHAMRLIASAHPGGVAFNMAAVAAAANGFGEKNVTPRDLIDLFTARGTFGYTTLGPNNKTPITDANPIREIAESQLTALVAINSQMMAIRAEMEVVSGVPFSTITEPDKDGLVGNAKIALLNRNNSLRYIDLAYRDILKRTAEGVIAIIQDQVQKDKGFKNFGMAIGYANVDIIEAMKRIPVERFGIMVETTPDVVEQEDMKNAVALSLQGGLIKPSAAVKVQNLIKDDPEKARRVLMIEERKFADEKAKVAQANAQMQASATAQAGVAVEQAKQQTAQIQISGDIQKMHVEYKLKSGQSHEDYLNDMRLALLQGEIKKEQIELAMTMQPDKGGVNNFDRANLPKASGERMPSVVPKPLNT